MDDYEFRKLITAAGVQANPFEKISGLELTLTQNCLLIREYLNSFNPGKSKGKETKSIGLLDYVKNRSGPSLLLYICVFLGAVDREELDEFVVDRYVESFFIISKNEMYFENDLSDEITAHRKKLLAKIVACCNFLIIRVEESVVVEPVLMVTNTLSWADMEDSDVQESISASATLSGELDRVQDLLQSDEKDPLPKSLVELLQYEYGIEVAYADQFEAIRYAELNSVRLDSLNLPAKIFSSRMCLLGDRIFSLIMTDKLLEENVLHDGGAITIEKTKYESGKNQSAIAFFHGFTYFYEFSKNNLPKSINERIYSEYLEAVWGVVYYQHKELREDGYDECLKLPISTWDWDIYTKFRDFDLNIRNLGYRVLCIYPRFYIPGLLDTAFISEDLSEALNVLKKLYNIRTGMTVGKLNSIVRKRNKSGKKESYISIARTNPETTLYMLLEEGLFHCEFSYFNTDERWTGVSEIYVSGYNINRIVVEGKSKEVCRRQLAEEILSYIAIQTQSF